ncbi:MAG: hypothetical protein R2851_01655 [Caldilineaceae bacterium]
MDHFLAHPPLTLAAVYPYLRARLEVLLPQQIDAPDSPDHGSLFAPEYGMADAKLSGHFVVTAAYCALAAERLGATAPPDAWLDRATLAARHLQRSQRPSGNLDLLSVNYDSAPDTAFTVQQLCTLFELAGDREEPVWRTLLAEVERFVRAAVPGIRTGGFHTPNHRWVMVSALVQANAAFPDLDVADVVNAYLAETFDCDAEGFFIERSVGVYDAVNDRSLLFIGQYWDSPDAVPTAARNLELNLHLLHADGTADTGLSRRQDYGSRTVPTQLIDCYLAAHAVTPTPRFVAVAHHVWDRAVHNPAGSDRANHFAHDVGWISYGLLRYGDPPLVDVEAAAKLPDDYARFFPVNRIWRVRRGLLSASFYGDTTRLLTLTMGRAELASLKISQTYFGQYTGRFIGQEFTLDDGADHALPGRPQPAARLRTAAGAACGQRRLAAHHARARLAPPAPSAHRTARDGRPATRPGTASISTCARWTAPPASRSRSRWTSARRHLGDGGHPDADCAGPGHFSAGRLRRHALRQRRHPHRSRRPRPRHLAHARRRTCPGPRARSVDAVRAG